MNWDSEEIFGVGGSMGHLLSGKTYVDEFACTTGLSGWDEGSICGGILKKSQGEVALILTSGYGEGYGPTYASRNALIAISESLEYATEECITKGEHYQRLCEALASARADLLEEVARNPSLEGMGTSAIIAKVYLHTLVYVHAGNCRLYLVRDGEVIHCSTNSEKMWYSISEKGPPIPIRRAVHETGVICHTLSSASSHDIIALSPPGRDKKGYYSAAFHLKCGDRVLLAPERFYHQVPEEVFLPQLEALEPKEFMRWALNHFLEVTGSRNMALASLVHRFTI